eukprot:CAMPEP_0194483992 /NCGR_PEP_ID=MMETSP0253-20130528/5462_1 /TAXON_ID=2966 /ORGANISM="Noctiluca scintillans" /LENGTH=68 /DNA_ID=CAMNT_0039323731 /DNA_START=481 /DNA_END=684 /DNA_ORIENTATION=-
MSTRSGSSPLIGGSAAGSTAVASLAVAIFSVLAGSSAFTCSSGAVITFWGVASAAFVFWQPMLLGSQE